MCVEVAVDRGEEGLGWGGIGGLAYQSRKEGAEGQTGGKQGGELTAALLSCHWT